MIAEAEARVKSQLPAEKPKGFRYSDGSVLMIHEHGYRRHTPKPLSKRERAKIKRQQKRTGRKQTVGITIPASARIGGFFA